MNRIRGKKILITGASSGIGEGCARCLASYGADLILVARRLDRLQKLQKELEEEYEVSVHIDQLDVGDRPAVVKCVQNLEQLDLIPDVLINNAGLASGLGKIFEGNYDDWDRMIDTNLKGLLNVSREIIPYMVKRNSGHVVNIGSLAGHWVYPGGNVYNATKFGVKALTEAMNIDLFGTNIRVSSIDPGATETEFSLVRFSGDADKAKDVYRGFTPLRAEDVADAVFFTINAPEHVNVFNLVIMPTAQRRAKLVYKEE